MYCKITATDRSYSRQTKIVSAIAEIATTPAGGTPDDSFLSDTTIEVIDNTTAGGWEIWDDYTTIHPDGTTYAPNNNYGARLALLSPSVGKSGYTHTYLSFTLLKSNYINNNNNNGNGYSHPEIHMGFVDTSLSATESNHRPNRDLPNMAEHFSNRNTGYPEHGCRPGNANNATSTSFNGRSADEGNFLGDYYQFAGTITYYVLATEDMIHIHQGENSSNQIYGAWFHYGKRTHQDWEENFSDNPYWVGMWQDYYYHNNDSYSSGVRPGYNTSGYYTMMRGINTENDSNIEPFRCSASSVCSSYDYQTDPLTGIVLGRNTSKNIGDGYRTAPYYTTNNTYYPYVQYFTNVTTTSFYSSSYWDGNQSSSYLSNTNYFLKYPMWNMPPSNERYENVGYSYDPNTGVHKFTAHQIRVAANRGYNEGGVMKHILGGTKIYKFDQLNAIMPNSAHGSSVIINGENYVQFKVMGNHGVIYVKKD